MRVIDIENINTAMNDENRFVLHCEEVFHDKVSSAAAQILSIKDKKPLVALTGPSGSGKTTTAMRLKLYLENLGVSVCLLSMDNFFYDSDSLPPEADDWESPYCVNTELLMKTIDDLSKGKETLVPKFDYKIGKAGSYEKMQGVRDSVIITEGIHMLNPLIFDKIKDVATGIYVAPRTRIITSDDSIVKPEHLRVARRLLRDYNSRGHSLRSTIERSQSVDRGEKNHISPYKSNALIHIDSFHDYEPCILSKYLKEIPQFNDELTPEFMEEHGLSALMNVVNSVQPLKTDYVPKDSIVREFVGGSCFKY